MSGNHADRGSSAPRSGNAALRPADFLLPKAGASAAARGDAQIYLSWGGEIYGPATGEEIAAGLRASWFEEGALFWHEGLEDWKPVTEFSFPARRPAQDSWPRVVASDVPSAPSLPRAGRAAKAGKPKPQPLGGHGRAIVFGFVLLAVLLTVGIILALMLV